MSFYEYFWHPTLLLLVAIAALPITLKVKSWGGTAPDFGYRSIFWGSVLVTFAAFIDYAEEFQWGSSFLAASVGMTRLEGNILPFLYFPGVLVLCVGVAMWLPAAQKAKREADRRAHAEAELVAIVNEMRNLSVRAEDASQAKADFLAAMGHELRTPLNAVIGFTELLEGNPGLDAGKRQEYLKIVLESGRSLLDQINNILEFTTLARRQAVGKPEAIELGVMIEKCLAFKVARHGGHGIDITHHRQAGVIWSDHKILKQIILNILSNAIKFTPKGGKIDISYVIQPDGFGITVADTGIGMDSEEVAVAMKPFFQVDQGLTRHYEGTGLGLPLADRFCRKLGGRLVMFSEKGRGTNVSINLPHLINDRVADRSLERQTS